MMSTLHRGVMAFVESKSDAKEPAGKIAGLLDQDTPRCAQAAVIAGGHRPPPEQLDESRRLVKKVQMRGGEGGAAACTLCTWTTAPRPGHQRHRARGAAGLLRGRSRGRTRTDAAAAAPGRPRSFVCTRSTSRSGPG